MPLLSSDIAVMPVPTDLRSAVEEADIIVAQNITAFTITLADTMGTTGTIKPNTGARVHIRRDDGGGTPSGALTVKDGGGTTLVNAITAASSWDFQFNGTAWAAVTGVTQDTQWY
jgi:hypothetical protein